MKKNYSTTTESLLQSLKVINYKMSKRDGLSVNYHIGSETFYNLPIGTWLTTTHLSDCLMIEDRRVREGVLEVCVRKVWLSFALYCDTHTFSEKDILYLAIRIEQNKGIAGVRRYDIININPDLN
jgi:hypothetical protein